MKYLKWLLIIILSVSLSVAFTGLISQFFDISIQLVMAIMFIIVFPLAGFIFDIFRLSKIDKA